MITGIILMGEKSISDGMHRQLEGMHENRNPALSHVTLGKSQPLD